MTSSAVAVIRPAALIHNLNRVRQAAPGCPVMAVIKAQAYGHGAVTVARALEAADAFAVARLEEALELRDAGINKPLVLLGGFHTPDELSIARSQHIQLVVHNNEQLAILEAAAANTEAARAVIWIKVDTGMGRIGMDPALIPDVVQRLKNCASVDPAINLLTHLACADEMSNPATPKQLENFARVTAHWQGDISSANSAGILAWPGAVGKHGGGQNWVRPGLMLYGASPVQHRTAADFDLLPAMSFETQLIAVRHLPKGSSVGYGGDWRAQRDSVIGVAAVGYADGYPRQLASGTPVRVNDVLAPLTGRVSMDMISIDLTDVPASAVGDRVVLWGETPTVDEIAGRANTLAYECLTRMGRRIPYRLDSAWPD